MLAGGRNLFISSQVSSCTQCILTLLNQHLLTILCCSVSLQVTAISPSRITDPGSASRFDTRCEATAFKCAVSTTLTGRYQNSTSTFHTTLPDTVPTSTHTVSTPTLLPPFSSLPPPSRRPLTHTGQHWNTSRTILDTFATDTGASHQSTRSKPASDSTLITTSIAQGN